MWGPIFIFLSPGSLKRGKSKVPRGWSIYRKHLEEVKAQRQVARARTGGGGAANGGGVYFRVM